MIVQEAPLFTPNHSILTWGGSEALPKFFYQMFVQEAPLFTPNHSILTWGVSEALPKFFLSNVCAGSAIIYPQPQYFDMGRF